MTVDICVNRMLDLVSKYYWPRISEEVKEYYVSMAQIKND